MENSESKDLEQNAQTEEAPQKQRRSTNSPQMTSSPQSWHR